MKINKYFLYSGVIWTILFACISFYWAMGGMLGVRSLGGAIYEMALHPTPSFITIVWITGFIKLLGAIMLIMLLVKWKNPQIHTILYFLTKTAGILLFFYGLLNFITYVLNAVGFLSYDLDNYTLFWRIVLWEPYWMIGGIFYFFSIKRGQSPDLLKR